jgi:hypothetical protein
MMSASPYHSVGLAMGRLRKAVNFCCWVVGAALALQVVVWSLATFTEVRYQALERAGSPLVVTPDDARPTLQSAGVAPLDAAQAGDIPRGEPAPDPNRVVSRYDHICRMAATLAGSAGTLAILMLLPLLAVGTILGAGSATPGIDKTVSAFAWSMLLAMLVLPLGEVVTLPWRQGAITSYDLMIEHVEAMGGIEAEGDVVFYARFLLLPGACLIGTVLVALRFGAGVEAALLPRESFRLDPVLEREAANVKPTSLMGGRAAGALAGVLNNAKTEPKPMPAATQVAAGELPKRLI